MVFKNYYFMFASIAIENLHQIKLKFECFRTKVSLGNDCSSQVCFRYVILHMPTYAAWSVVADFSKIKQLSPPHVPKDPTIR